MSGSRHPRRATLDTWVWCIAERMVISQRRKRRVASRNALDPKLAALTAQSEELLPPDVRYERAAARHAVHRFLAGTRPRWSSLLVARYFDERTPTEIAATSGCTPVAVGVALDRAKRAALAAPPRLKTPVAATSFTQKAVFPRS